MKTRRMYVYANEKKYGEIEFFFEEDVLILSCCLNDASYSDEYHGGLFEHFGIEVSYIEKLNKKQLSALRVEAKRCGYEELDE